MLRKGCFLFLFKKLLQNYISNVYGLSSIDQPLLISKIIWAGKLVSHLLYHYLSSTCPLLFHNECVTRIMFVIQLQIVIEGALQQITKYFFEFYKCLVIYIVLHVTILKNLVNLLSYVAFYHSYYGSFNDHDIS